MSIFARTLKLPYFSPAYHIGVGGYRPAIAQTISDVWNGPTELYPEAIAPRELTVSSLAAMNDVAGSGAQVIQLMLTDPEQKLVIVDVELAGVTPVPVIGGPYLDVLACEVQRTGTYGAAQGADVEVDAAGTVVAVVKEDRNRSSNCSITVPHGFHMRILGWSVTTRLNHQNATGVFLLQRRYPGGPWVEIDVYDVQTIGGRGTIQVSSPAIIEAGTRYRMQAYAEDQTINAYGVMHFETTHGPSTTLP